MNFIYTLENQVSLSIVSLTPSNLGSNSYILLLKSNEDELCVFPIVIGTAEAQTISIFLENIEIPRPLTSQLTFDILNVLTVEVLKVEITDFKDGIFYSKLYLEKDSQIFELDARPSDAIALAIKAKASIFIAKDLLQAISLPSDEMEISEEQKNSEVEEEGINVTDLTKKLDQALENEDYETAAQLRDQIQKLKIK